MKGYKSIDMRLFIIDEIRHILIENIDLSVGEALSEIFRPSNFTNPQHTNKDISYLKNLSTNDMYHATTIARRKLREEIEELEQRKKRAK